MPEAKPRRQLSPRTKERRAVLAALAKAEDRLEAAETRLAKAIAAHGQANQRRLAAQTDVETFRADLASARAEARRVLDLPDHEDPVNLNEL